MSVARSIGRTQDAGLFLFRLLVQVVGRFEGVLEVKIDTFAIFIDGKSVLLIVPNRIAGGVSLPSHYVPRRHRMNSLQLFLFFGLCVGDLFQFGSLVKVVRHA